MMIKNQKFFICFLMAMCIGLQPLNARSAQKNMLNKLFYHGSAADSLELGKAVFCFGHEIKHIHSEIKKRSDTREERIYQFSDIDLNDAVKSMLQSFNAHQNADYQFQVRVEPRHIILSITYNPKKIYIAGPEKFTNIDGQAGIMWRAYNKQCHEALSDYKKPLLRVASSKKKTRIVIDCGHGGADFGTIGCFNVAEKEVTLQVGLKVAHLLKQDGYDVLLTRTMDQTVPLDERTTFANQHKADLFVSIHANHSSKPNVSGIETYCLSNETKLCDKNQLIPKLYAQALQEKIDLGNTLANCVHSSMLAQVKKKHGIVDRKVKRAMSQVLLGSCMPAILTEIAFLSNAREATRFLQQKNNATRSESEQSYPDEIALGIRNGINKFIEMRG